MSRKATGYHCRLKTYLHETSYGIKNFVTKLNLFKNCSFPERKSFPDLYFKVILTSVTDDITLTPSKNYIVAGRISFNLPRDTLSEAVMELTRWHSIYDLYKLSLFKLFYNIVCDNIPPFIPDWLYDVTVRITWEDITKPLFCDFPPILWKIIFVITALYSGVLSQTKTLEVF